MSQQGRLEDIATATETLTGDTGGAVSPDPTNTINIVGGPTITVAGNPGTNTLTISVTGGGFPWTEVTGTTQSLAVDNGYIANNAGLVTLTLPTTASLGEPIQIVGKGAGLYTIAQNAGQTIHFVASSTTTGVGGSLTAIEQFATLEIVCTTANTDWTVVDSGGNFTVI